MTKRYKGLRGQSLYHGSTGKRSLDTYWTNFVYSKLYPNKKNRYIGGSLSHGEHLGNNHILSRPPDWDELLGYADDNQQLSAAVHDYQLATAKTLEGVRIAHSNYAKNAHGMITMGLFDGLARQKRPYGFEVYNLEPGYNPPPEVYKRLRIEQPTRGNEHFNVALDPPGAPKRFVENVSRDTSQRKSLRMDFNMETLPQESVLQIMDFQGDVVPDVIAENFSDNDLPMNLHTDHNLEKSMSKNFGDTKKLATTNVQVGSGSSLTSVPSILGSFYKGARTLSTTWHHSGASALDNRSVFTYAFRHTLKKPVTTGTNKPSVVLSPAVEVENPKFGSQLASDIAAYDASTGTASASGYVSKFTDTNGMLVRKPINVSSWDGTMNITTVTIDDTEVTSDPNLTADDKARLITLINISLLSSSGQRMKYTNGTEVSVGSGATKPSMSSLPTDLTSKHVFLPFYTMVEKSGVKLISPERSVRSYQNFDLMPSGTTKFDVTASSSVVPFTQSTWYSPFCLQELETLSWNLNRMKLIPTKKGMYEGTAAAMKALPGRVSKDAILSADDFVNDAEDAIDPNDMSVLTDSAFGTFVNKKYNANILSDNSPLYEFGQKYGKDSFLSMTESPKFEVDDDEMLDQAVGPAVAKKAELADFKAQLGKSECLFTFVNTGDTTMIVDAVCHRAKEHMAVGANSNLSDDGIDLTSKFAKAYMSNYIDYHRANQIRKVSNDVPLVTDCLLDPETKFLPTSYRLPKSGVAPTLESTTPETVVQDVSFIDTDRRKLIIGPNSRKTIRFVMPTKAYIPFESSYNGLINDHSLAITFGVTGKSTKAVADTIGDALAAQAVGRIAAPTSFHIIGRETQQVYPCCISEFSKPMKQIFALPDPELAAGQAPEKRLHSAMYIGPNLRDVKGRYAELHVDDGQPTHGQRHQSTHVANQAGHHRRLDDIVSNTAGTDVVLTGVTTTDPVPVTSLSTTVPNLLAINTDPNYASFVGILNVIFSEYAVSVGQVPSSIPVSGLLTMSSAPSHWSSSTLGFIYSDGSLADSSYLLLNTHYNFVGS